MKKSYKMSTRSSLLDLCIGRFTKTTIESEDDTQEAIVAPNRAEGEILPRKSPKCITHHEPRIRDSLSMEDKERREERALIRQKRKPLPSLLFSHLCTNRFASGQCPKWFLRGGKRPYSGEFFIHPKTFVELQLHFKVKFLV